MASIHLGTNANETLNGTNENDTYLAANGWGNDSIIDPSGTDSIDQSAVTAALNINMTSSAGNEVTDGTNTINWVGNIIENITTGSGRDTVNGSTGDNYIATGAGNDAIWAGLGNDTIDGGDGNERYVYTGAWGNDSILDSAGLDTLDFSTSILNLTFNLTSGNGNEVTDGTSTINWTGDIIENVRAGSGNDNIAGSSADNSLSGGGGNDTLNGGLGNDTLDGGLGDDTLIGNIGDDTYWVNSLLDSVVESAKQGNDTVFSSVNYTLGSNIENLELSDNDNLNGAGNGLDNSLIGNNGDNSLFGDAGNDSLEGGNGNDTLDGGKGNDTLIGGLGNDTYIIDNAKDVIDESNDPSGIDLVIASIQVDLNQTAFAHIENVTLTGKSNLNVTGNASANILIGNSGNNSLDGGTGIDQMAGGLGNDTYIVDNTNDQVNEAFNQGNDTVIATADYHLSDQVENLILVGSSALSGYGNSLANQITGNMNNNTLDGGLGDDNLIGKDGDDTYLVDSIKDKVSESGNQGNDTVIASISYTLGSNLENLNLSGSDNTNGSGNGLNNNLIGNDGNNSLFGDTGNDSLIGAIGNDTLDGGKGVDTLIGGIGSDWYILDNPGDVIIETGPSGDSDTAQLNYEINGLIDLTDLTTPFATIENVILSGKSNTAITGNDANNNLVGNKGNNSLVGAAGNDTLDGGDGNDTLVGGDGDDTYVIDSAKDVIEENGGPSDNDTVMTSITTDLTLPAFANIENIMLTGKSNLNAMGNDANNILIGNTGNNILNGGVGVDQMSGGLGNDTYFVDNLGDTVNETQNGGQDSVIASVNFTLGHDVENLTLTGNAQTAIGNELDNTLIGNDQDNTLDGGLGKDAMQGGLGNDTYLVDNAKDSVTEQSNQGIDTVVSSISYSLGKNLENLTLSGSGDINGTGNDFDNILLGNSGNNSLDGGKGADQMSGGAGNDTYLVDNAGDTVTEEENAGNDTVISSFSYVLGANIENLTLTGKSNIVGTGNDLANILIGNAGDNTLIGGEGDDTYVIQNAKDLIIETGLADVDTVQSEISYVLGSNLENLILTGKSNLNATGNEFSNSLQGNGGNNILDGGAGADQMSGGQGNDTYYVDNLGDTVNETQNGGQDSVIASVNFTLGHDVENLTLTGNAQTAIGNELDNTLVGNDQDNTLDGGLGKDAMQGGLGNDTYLVDNAKDSVTEQSNQGIDTVVSSISYSLGKNLENLTLSGSGDINGTGNDLDNILLGNSGNNSLDGGKGADQMGGGLGNDTYMVDNADDVITEGEDAGLDTVISSFSYALGANLENLTLTGKSDLSGTGNELANILVGNSGKNTLTGGEGDDTYVIQNTGDTIVETGVANLDTVQSEISYVLGSSLENLILTGKSNTSATGNELSNDLQGNSGNNILDGGTGADRMAGGMGNDTYYVDNHGDVITEEQNAGTDTVIATYSYDLADNIENLTLAGDLNLVGNGNNLNNKIIGNNADNLLDGRGGIDTMQGQDGNDFYFVDNSRDQVVESSNQGNDWVQSSVSFTLGNNVEGLILANVDHITGTGNSDANGLVSYASYSTLDGGSGNDVLWAENNGTLMQGGSGHDLLIDDVGSNTLDGGSGNDLMMGGTGNTTYLNPGDMDGIIDKGGFDTLSLTKYKYNDVDFYAADYLTGSRGLNLGPDGRLDTLVVWIGNQEIDLFNFFGNNSATVTGSSFGSGLIEQFNFKDVTVTPSDILWYLNYYNVLSDFPPPTASPVLFNPPASPQPYTLVSREIVGTSNNDTLAGSDDLEIGDYIQGLDGNDALTGGDGEDALYGGNGDDILDGGGGNDFLSGGAGSDTYLFSDGWGHDVLDDTHVDTTDGANGNVLNFSGVTSNLTINATSGATDGANTVVWQDLSLSQIWGGTGNDLIQGGSSADVLHGGNGNDQLIGDAGNDSLIGEAGNDTLNGGLGNDFLLGGLDNDSYQASPGRDAIYDLSGIDQLNLTDYSWSTGHVTLQAADFVNNNGLAQPDGLYDSVILTMGDRQINLLGYFDNTSANISNSGQGLGLIESIEFSDQTLSFADIQAALSSAPPASNQDSQQETIAFYQAQANAMNSLYTFFPNTSQLPGGVVSSSGNSSGGSNIPPGGTHGLTTSITDVPADYGYEGFGPETADPALISNTFNQSQSNYGNDSSNDDISGSANGPNVFFGRTGNDTLHGGTSLDGYNFENDWGNDSITDAGGNDTVIFVPVSSNVQVNLSLDNGTPQAIAGNNTVSWSGQIIENAMGGNGNDLLIGNSAGNYLYGGDGFGNDTLYGLGGNDYLIGFHGDDVFYGGSGNDTFEGGGGDDTYYFSKRDGNDMVEDYINPPGLDTIKLDNTIQQSQVALYMDGADLKIGYTDTSDSSITIWNQTEPGFAIERFELSDGSYLTSADVNQVIQTMASVAIADGISLSNINDVKEHGELMAVINAAWHH